MSKKKDIKAFDFNGAWEYSPSPESTSHVQLKEKYDLYIDGKFVAPSSKTYFKTINPANEKVLAEVAHANEKDVDLAVKAAKKAYDTVWSKLSAKERGKYIYRIARMMQERSRELAVVETLDAGKTIHWLVIISFIMQVGRIN